MTNNWQPHLPHFVKGERLSAARLNELADAVMRLMWQKQASTNSGFGVQQPLEIIGKLDDNLPPATDFETTPGTAVMSVYTKDANGELVYQGRKENVRQRFESATELAANAEVKARWIEGEWMADAASGGGVFDIEFTVISMDCYSDPWILTVEPTWFTGGCTAAIPGADPYTGYVEVENRCNIADHFTAENIVGLTGTATYRYPRTDSYCTPAWRLDDICGEGECPL